MSEETKQPSTDDGGKKAPVAQKPAAKKPAAKKPAAKKPVAKKPVTPKPAVKRAAPKKTAATAAKKPTSTAAKKPSVTKSAAAKRTTTAKKAAPVKTGAAKPAEPVSASAEKASPSAAKVGPEASATSNTSEHARADAKAEQHSSRNDHGDDPYSAENLAADFKEKDWKEVFVRAAFTVFYIFAGWIAVALGFTFTVVQFLIHLVTGHPNDVVKNAILCVGQYIGDLAAYVSFDSDERPFPFGKDLPDGK